MASSDMDLPQPSPSGPLWPVSIKGVVRSADRVLLAYNDRDEWELPGGRLEGNEQPEETVVREVAEESGVIVTAGRLLITWVQPVDPLGAKRVLIVCFDCPVGSAPAPIASDEHRDVRWWSRSGLSSINLPIGYRRAIDTAYGG
ncbi:MAG: NUDIX hydrolase [Actinomycetota bacterium]